MRMVLESLLPKLKNERIRWFSDNQNVVRILEVGSKNPPLQREALAVFSMAARSLIRIEPEWIPCAHNQQADYLSRIQDRDDWMIQAQWNWTNAGDHIPLTDLLTIRIVSCQDLIPDAGALAQKQ